MTPFLRNWKTTAAGVATLLTALSSIMTSISSGDTPSPEQVGLVFMSIVAIFARDADKSSLQTGIQK